MEQQCGPLTQVAASAAATVAGAGNEYYRDLGKRAGRAIVLGVEAPKDQGCWSPVTGAFVAPFEEGLRSQLEPFIGKKVVFAGAGVLLAGGLLGWWLRGRRS